jgi:hypothetical protein
MAKWEYSKTDLNGLARKTAEIDLLNDLGRDGWELVNIAPNNLAYFKRPFVGPTPAMPARERKSRPA